ncbi:unnamed protein product [Mytilus edulis]|uniref:CCHC-type domain-containing protein n=1 Tax=Mytilus edulis TaxID=6550 RepID=A0A8S3RY68_MYTED|nr:unnamed protein product [Mytilus edulis]
MTEKGLFWQLDTLQQNLKKAISAWHSKHNKLSILLSDSDDLAEIRATRDSLVKCMSQIEDIYRHLSRLLSGVGSEHSQLASEIGTDISQKFEQCETDTATILKEITKRIQCIDEVKSERSSRRSSRSNRSVSERSHVSSRISNASKLSETAARAAELKTKLKYIEAESKAKLELDKIQTRRELETAEVKLEILEGVSQGGSVLDDAKKYLPQADIMTNFLKTVSASHDQNKNSSVPNILSSSVPFTSDTNVDYAINQNQPVVAPFVSSSGLNPEVNEFVPIQRETSSFRAMDHVQTDSVHVDLPKTEMPIMSKTISSDVVTDLAKSFADQVNLNRLPPPEPPIFNGDPLKYASWKVAFETLIKRRNIPPLEQIHYLRRYVGDSVREVIENFFLIATDDSYFDAKKLLDQRYGDPFIVGNAFHDRLEKWPKIASRDSLGLRKFSDYIKQCLSALKTIKNLNVLNDDRENRKLLLKISGLIVTRWGRIVAQHKSDHHTFPSFQTFSVFIERESTIANDPVTSLNSLKTDSTPRNTDTNFRSVKNDRDTPRRNAFATETKSTSYDRTKESNSGANKNCLFCHKAGHILDSCRNYLAKSVQERKEFAKRTGLCFACLGSGHLSKQCNKRATCSICTKRHPTAFHGDVVKQYPNNSKQPTPCNEEKELYKSQTGAVLMSITESCGKSSMIVPVYLSHTDNQQHEILVYALLDTQSDTTFILDNTRQTLGLSGTDVKLSLSTMHSQNSIVDSCKIDGLIVRAYDSDMKICPRHLTGK